MTGEAIEKYLNAILKSYNYGNQKPGRVLSTLIIPDFTKQLGIEIDLLDL